MEYPPSMELLNRGSIVSCTNGFNQTIEGGVMAYDPTTKLLILKCAAESGQAKMNDVYVVNLEFCSDVHIKEEVHAIPNAPPLLNLQRIATRKRNAVEDKQRLVMALTAGVTAEGRQMFMAISKTIGQNVNWQGTDICVFNDTRITHPYRPENVSGSCDRQVVYVKKLVESQWKYITPSSSANAGTNSSSSSSAAAASATNASGANAGGGGETSSGSQKSHGNSNGGATTNTSSSTSATSSSSQQQQQQSNANNQSTSASSEN